MCSPLLFPLNSEGELSSYDRVVDKDEPRCLLARVEGIVSSWPESTESLPADEESAESAIFHFRAETRDVTLPKLLLDKAFERI